MFFFDANYFKLDSPLFGIPTTVAGYSGNATIGTQADCVRWLAALPQLKDAIDRWSTAKKSNPEREAQQLLVRENNQTSAVSTATDYFVLDVEYARGDGRADVIAVHWPSTSIDRKVTVGRRLAIVELKFGDAALAGASGLVKHVEHTVKLAGNGPRLDLCKEMLKVYEQKRSLGLIDNKRELGGLDDSGLDLVLVLANHDPDKTVLK